MRTKLKVAAGLAVLVAAPLSAVIIGSGASAQTPVPPPAGAVIVGTTGPYCASPTYSTIQSAIDAVSAGATIYVCTGTYTENLTIDKPITLDGAQYDVDGNAGARVGADETVIDGNGGITYTAGATSGTIDGFTLTGYQGSVAEIDADAVGSGWRFTNNIVDVSNGGIFVNTDAVADPATSAINANDFIQTTPSAAPSGDEGDAIILGDGTTNNLNVTGNAFQELSGPGAAISTPGTAACGSTLDTTNFSENLYVTYNTMTENGGAFTDPSNGPGFTDEPFIDLECTNNAHVSYNTVTDTTANDTNAKTAIDMAGGDWSTVAVSDALTGNGASGASGFELNNGSFPAGTGETLLDNTVSGFGADFNVQGGTGYEIWKNVVKSAVADGISVQGGSGGSIENNAVSGSGTDDCLDSTVGAGTASTADTWSANGGTTSSPAGLCAPFALPAFTSGNNYTVGVGTPITPITITTSGWPTPKIHSTALPSGLTLTDNGNGTATIAGTLPASKAGIRTIKLTAVNVFRETMNKALQSITLQVTRSPVIIGPTAKTIVTNTPFSFRLRAQGFPVPAFTYTGSLPPGVTFTDNGNGTATVASVTGVTPPVSSLTWPINVTATNSVGTANHPLTITIRTPVVTFDDGAPLQATDIVGQPFTDTIQTSTDLPTPTLSEVGALPTGVHFVDNGNGTATLSGTAAAGSAHQYRIQVDASTIAGTISKTLVLSVDTVPVFSSSPSLTVHVGATFSFHAVAHASPGASVVQQGTLPPGVTVQNGTGRATIFGVVASSGTWTFSFVATNPAGSTTQSFTLIAH